MSASTLSALQYKYFRYFDLCICLPFIFIPLFVNLPYRVNIFLSWEGAYRLYLGQTPFEDFGLPMGFGYWLIPTLFFKLFGPTLASLIKAEVFINLLSLVAIRGILYNLKVKPIIITFSLLIACLTYVIYNFWPWYNHSVVVFELVGFYFLTLYTSGTARKMLWLIVSALFMFLSFFTKQDVGAIGFVMSATCIALVGYQRKELKYLAVYVVAFFAIGAAVILPFAKYDFFYWFNLGQAPHSSRISLALLLDTVMLEATWEKVYLALFVILFIVKKETLKSLWVSHDKLVLTLLCLGLIGQAIVTRVTSPLPTNHMTYFHIFGFILIAYYIDLYASLTKLINVFAVACVVMVLFSDGYWKYLSPILKLEKKPNISATAAEVPASKPWVQSHVYGFANITMPSATVEGVKRIMQLDVARKKDLKVLNMSELTPLALAMGYTPITHQSLWYHFRVGIFQKEVDVFCERIKNQEYDLVLFEDIPSLNNFYPYQIRDALYQYYNATDKFLAPRKLEDSTIEVFVKKNSNSNL